MKFVAIDLETTGLSPDTDTIIEVACVRFSIEKIGDKYTMTDVEEHSQLVYPGQPLSQEVTMITGISSDMLEGKPEFASIRDRVRDFIGDAVIVGHNVLFDIAMFRTHGIDLSANIVIDTFELSELFSQDIESLNLGFLANRYGLIDPTEAEHRALTDTKVSVRLFLRYLGEVAKLEGKKKSIWDTLSMKDESKTLLTLSRICHQDTPQITENGFFDNLIISAPERETQGLHIQDLGKSTTPILQEIHGNRDEEIKIIKDTFKEHSHIRLITPGYKIAVWMSQLLTENNIENIIELPTHKWCSVQYLESLLTRDGIYPRKKIILILKLTFWLKTTETGLLDELKFYGEERNMLDIFRCQEDEWNIWREKYTKETQITPVLISNLIDTDISDIGNNRYTLIKDIPLIEDIIRRKESQDISFEKISASIELLSPHISAIDARTHMADMFSIIKGIYESIPDRPTGPLASPPGNHGETYFVTQAMLWHRGHKWLVHASRALDSSWKSIQDSFVNTTFSRETTLAITYIDRAISSLLRYHSLEDNNTNIILTIQDEETCIALIPRSIKESISSFIRKVTGYGVNITLPQTESFLIREYGYSIEDFPMILESSNTDERISLREYHPDIIKPGTVILTTSQKHARDIGQALRKIHGKNTEILIQGLSGGKGKMLSTFKRNIDSAILVGIIDTWRDEYDLWRVAKHIILVKLPFDPPTDPYFLARTVGMNNNFSEYSEPIVTIRLNTLIERIISSGYTGMITFSDPRLTETEWGKRIAKELL